MRFSKLKNIFMCIWSEQRKNSLHFGKYVDHILHAKKENPECTKVFLLENQILTDIMLYFRPF